MLLLYPETLLFMWLLLAIVSSLLLGFYDVFKKHALRENAVLPVLLLSTLFSSLLFLPFIALSHRVPGLLAEHPLLYVPPAPWEVHRLILLKSALVLTSWIFGYFGMKHLPLTIVGPINATRPVMVLLGATLLFGERLNGLQWVGVILGITSFFLLSRSGRKEGIDFRRNRWIACVVAAAVLGALSGLYDKFLMRTLDPMLVQSWHNVYQFGLMSLILPLLWWPRRRENPFRWRWSIPLISLFLCAADFAYFCALSESDSLISVISMIRRSSVIVSFGFGALVFHEKNLRSKAFDLLLVLLGLAFLCWGSL